MTKIEIIEETANFYNLGNRSVDETKSECRYKSNTIFGEKQCAFQRCVETDLSPYEGKSASKIFSYLNQGRLVFKKGYEGHGQEFWMLIQNLHDHHFNWTIDGLSEKGKIKVEELKKRFANE